MRERGSKMTHANGRNDTVHHITSARQHGQMKQVGDEAGGNIVNACNLHDRLYKKPQPTGRGAKRKTCIKVGKRYKQAIHRKPKQLTSM